MDTGKDRIRGPDEALRKPVAPGPAADTSRRQGNPASALSVTQAETLSMDRVNRFFSGIAEPQGNVLVSEMADENGALAGRETARGKRRSGSLATQFSDDDRSVLFAPNDAPDELPQQPTELDRLLRQQEFRERRRFNA